jgi:hypothetical protein
MHFWTAEESDLFARLERDIERTVGATHRGLVRERASEVLDLEGDELAFKVIDDAQQIIHDTFADTTWPTCPRHVRHPLWFSDGAWRCSLDQSIVVPLGELVSDHPDDGRWS